MARISRDSVAYSSLFVGLILLFFAVGGLVVTLGEERVDSVTGMVAMLGGTAGAAALLVSACFYFLLRRKPVSDTDAISRQSGMRHRQVVFSLVLFILMVVATLACMNAAASFFTVPWPMSGLHGVSLEVGKGAWNYQDTANGFTQVNSWGQRDREHDLLPTPGTRRIIMLGDSFLEDGAAIPLPVRLEEDLKTKGLSSYEVINLGVSATDPDEYFFRLKKVGLKLRPRHCVLLLSASSDFIQEPSLTSMGGIVAPYPRDSFLQCLGLHALNHALSNHRRPILRAWFEGGALLKHELKLAETFRGTSNDKETEAALLSFFPQENQAQIIAALRQSSATERAKFYEMLRRPDEGKFRSHYLNLATRRIMGVAEPSFVQAEYAFRWIRQAAAFCRSNGIAFTLVVIPDGFSVDARMAQQWRAIYNMRAYMQHKDDAAQRLVQHARNEGMEVVNLRDLLTNVPGAYLNMDGHWSQFGVDVVAEHLAELLKNQVIGTMTGQR
jgi:hypothetical protein